MDGMALVIISHRSFKSTFGANNGEGKEENTWTKGKICSADEMKNGEGKKENICIRKISFLWRRKKEKKNIWGGKFFVEKKTYL